MKAWLVRIGVGTTVSLMPFDAAATLPPIPPDCTIRWNQEIPRGGVLYGVPDYDVPADDLLPRVRSMRVTWDDGMEIAGSLDLLWLGGSGGRFVSSFLWRPTAPLERTGELHVELELDATDDECIAENPRPSSSVMVVDDPEVAFEPLVPKPLTGVIDLLDLVCCDGAMPTAPSYDHNIRADEITWAEGYCLVEGPLAPGEANLAFSGEAELDELHVSHWLMQIVDGDELLAASWVGGDMWFAFDRPLTAQLQFVDLASGEVIVSEQGLDVPGHVPLDVVPEDGILAAMDAKCDGSPYVCNVPLADVKTWSHECHGFEVDDDDFAAPDATASCGCRTNAPRPWLLLAFVPLLLRRRIRSAAASSGRSGCRSCSSSRRSCPCDTPGSR